MNPRTLLSLVVLMVSFAGGCDSEDTSPAKIYPADWRESYLEVRGCRASPDHDLEFVSLWMDPASKAQWDSCVDAFPEGDSTCGDPFPEGATFLKPQYLDPACTELARLSIARKASGFDDVGGWHWQEVLVTNGRERVSHDGALTRCSGCHALCDGHDMRCYMDP